MKEYEIKLSDIQRILLGEVPNHFYIEVIFRVAVIYLILLIAMRVMGKRMSSQLSRNEMAAVASLAAAVGIPLMNPDRGMLPAVIVAVVIIFYQKIIAKRASKNKKFESLTQDKYNMLVKDGVLNTSAMLLTRISRDRVFSQLRSKSISHLGEVKRLYFEAGGDFSILEATEEQPGLSIVPVWDDELSSALHVNANEEVCTNCGNAKPEVKAADVVICPNCKQKRWSSAVKKR